MRHLILFLTRFLSAESTQRMLLDLARRLAQKTNFEWDDAVVNAFSDIWRGYYRRKDGNNNH